MRAKTWLVFSAGFACGLLFLAVLLWRTGSLHTASAAQFAPAAAAEQPLPAPAEPTSRNPYEPPNTTPAPAPPRPGNQIIIPVQGVRTADLHDNYADTREGRRHEALDIMAPRGTPVIAAVDGAVAKLFLSKPGGITVYEFDNAGAYCYYYAHLDRYADGIREGMRIRQGDVLGYVGSTGNASAEAPHLHFAIFQLGPEKHWWQGTPINPYPVLTGRTAAP